MANLNSNSLFILSLPTRFRCIGFPVVIALLLSGIPEGGLSYAVQLLSASDSMLLSVKNFLGMASPFGYFPFFKTAL